MKERPILFSAPMVRAILDGRKTQTRRVVKPQPLAGCTDYWRVLKSTEKSLIDTWVPRGGVPDKGGGFPVQGERVRCPYGIRGDRLWVRESFAFAECENGDPLIVYRSDGAIADIYQLGNGPMQLNGFRREKWCDRNGILKWRPSIHMPRWASRITLEVVSVRVERLQGITQADIAREGIDLIPSSNPDRRDEFIWKFQELWDSINGPESWFANPWVWVVEFKRLETHV